MNDTITIKTENNNNATCSFSESYENEMQNTYGLKSNASLNATAENDRRENNGLISKSFTVEDCVVEESVNISQQNNIEAFDISVNSQS